MISYRFRVEPVWKGHIQTHLEELHACYVVQGSTRLLETQTIPTTVCPVNRVSMPPLQDLQLVGSVLQVPAVPMQGQISIMLAFQVDLVEILVRHNAIHVSRVDICLFQGMHIVPSAL